MQRKSATMALVSVPSMTALIEVNKFEVIVQSKSSSINKNFAETWHRASNIGTVDKNM